MPANSPVRKENVTNSKPGRLRKVALVSTGWTLWQQRVLSGALRYADANPRILIRLFAPLEDVPEGARAVQAWQAEGALGFLEDDVLHPFFGALDRRIPLANCTLTGEHPDVLTVVGDFSAFARTAIDHLRHLGLRSIALLVLEEGPQHRKRLVEPFLQIANPPDPKLAALVFQVDRNLLSDPESAVTPVPAPLANWLKALPKPVGIACPHQGGGGYLIRCCHALKIRVPEDVAVVGADETDFSLACNPRLTSVVLSMETVGHEAMRLLAGLMDGVRPPTSIVRLQCMNLAVRESTGLRRPEICDIAGALECIRTNATRGITVERVMEQTQRVSKVTFHRRFQHAVGKSPAEAIRERKLEEARRLLADTELPLELVSNLSGFSSARVLTRVFRGAEGLTPRDYRRRRQVQTSV